MKERLPVGIMLIIAVTIGFAGYYFYNQEKNQRISLQRQLDELNVKLTTTTSALNAAKKEVEYLSQKLQLAENQIRTLTDELENEKQTRREVITQLDQVRTELQNQVYQRLSLEQDLNKAKEDLKNTQEQMKRLEAIKFDLEAKIKDMEAKTFASKPQVELGQIVVSTETTPATQVQTPPRLAKTTTITTRPKVLKGSIMVINKEYNFAVINLGAKDGLTVGNVVSVFNDGKFLGDVKVEKIQESMSAVNFLGVRLKDKLATGVEYNFKIKS